MRKRGRRKLSQSSAVRGGFLSELSFSIFFDLISASSFAFACFSLFLLPVQLRPAACISFKHSSVAIPKSLSARDFHRSTCLSPAYRSYSLSRLAFGASPVSSSDRICLPDAVALSSSLLQPSVPATGSRPRTVVAAGGASVSSSSHNVLPSCLFHSRFPAAAGSAASLLHETTTARPSSSRTSAAAAASKLGLQQHQKQRDCCFLHAFPNISRPWPSRQKVRCSCQPSFSRRRHPCCWTPQTQQQQQHCWQGSAVFFSYCSVWGRHREKGKKEEEEEGKRSRGDNTRRYARSTTSKKEGRHGTALFDSQEERFSALKSLKEQETPKFQAEDWTPEMPLLEVEDLHVAAVEDGQEILKGVNLTVMPGEVHAIMGRNGSGKSTLSKVLAGYPSYKVTQGSVRYKGLDLLQLPIDNRGLAGLFLAFQYPIEIPMVSNLEFLRVAFNERRKWRGEEDIASDAFRQFVEGKLQEVGLESSFLTRPLNYGFSGGEKKRNEILQMIVLDPELVMLDETDSGLDVDSFNVTAAAIKRFAARKNKSFLVTTHYKKLLDVLLPHKIHVMHAGRVILSGDLSLASRIEKEGFASLISDDPREEEEKKGLARGENLLDNDEAYEPPSLTPSAAGGGRRDFDKLL